MSKNVDEQRLSRMIFSKKCVLTIFCKFFCSSVIYDNDKKTSVDSAAVMLLLDESVVALVE